MNKLFNVNTYIAPDGSQPVDEYLYSLPAKEALKIRRTISYLEYLGNGLRQPHCRPIVGQKGLYELRIQASGNAYRIFYLHYEQNTFTLLHAFMKKTPKTPQREIDIAVKRQKELLNRRP